MHRERETGPDTHKGIKEPRGVESRAQRIRENEPARKGCKETAGKGLSRAEVLCTPPGQFRSRAMGWGPGGLGDQERGGGYLHSGATPFGTHP